LKKTPTILRNFPIPRLAAIIEFSDLFISNDTGIMHVAGATKTPLISLFGPTDPEIWAPIGENKFYIKKDDDINSIKVEDVINLINKILMKK
ncbi:MAG: ADP-heptose--LPS heptosyltransferase, partial [Candidatus Omnitrophica bacterium]|nr:ADP-heptose--LPS heptosyltransferase [Candidatus Omnitrophota bacterium]